MPFNAHETFVNLAEKEKIKGHHSPEGRAIRTLSRALSGWSAGNLTRRDVIVMCEQGVEDWLKARLRLSPWASRTMPGLLVDALAQKLITPAETVRLQRLHHWRARADEPISTREVEAALEFSIEVIDKHW